MAKYERPWKDARAYSREIEVQKITAKDIIEAVKMMHEVPVNRYYVFLTEWVKPFASEEECIKYFADNGSVVVYDSKFRCWHKGLLASDYILGGKYHE